MSEHELCETIILSDNKNEIKTIYHISDIHIRKMQRHEEYKEIFNKVYETIEKNDSTLIVITGDVVHNKTDMCPELIDITFHFLYELNKIAPVILIAGNHDCNLSNKNRMDALSPIVNRLKNLHYLIYSGAYRFNNIIFGVSSLLDNKFIYADCIEQKQHKYNYKIALYHGAVHGAKTDVGYRMNTNELLVEDFEGYNFTMLGDIHKHQYMDDNKTVAYAGSLIQQSYGEKLKGHGILKWDLRSGNSELIEIENDYGFVTLNITNGILSKGKIPKKARIRFMLNNTTDYEYNEVLDKLKLKYQVIEAIKENDIEIVQGQINEKNESIDINNIKSHNKYIKNYLIKKNVNSDIIDKIISLHNNTFNEVSKNKLLSNNFGGKWKILELKFSNTLSYGENNVINFAKLDANKIIGIFAPNYHGKSAIIDIILFCLFDKHSRGERRDFINKNKNTMYCSLKFIMNDVQYMIERIGHKEKNDISLKVDVNFFSIEMKDGIKCKTNLNGLEKNETNRKICELIGDYKDYLLTNIFLQNDANTRFIDLTQKQKKTYLNEILCINYFEDCHEFVSEETKKLAVELKYLNQQLDTNKFDNYKENAVSIKNDIDSLKKQIAFYSSSIFNLNIPEIVFPKKYHELEKYKINSIADIKKHYLNLKNKIDNTDICHDTINIEELNEKLNGIKNKIANLQNKIMEKTQLIINIPKPKTTLDELNSEEIKAKDKIIKLNEQLEKYNPDKIKDIKNEISSLNASILSVSSEVSRDDIIEMEKEISKMKKFAKKITVKLSENDKKNISQEIKIKEEFEIYLQKCQTELNVKDKVYSMNSKWIEKFQQWKDDMEINMNDDAYEKYQNMCSEYETMLIDYDNGEKNKRIHLKVRKLTEELFECKKFQKIIDEIELYENRLNEIKTNKKNIKKYEEQIDKNSVIEEQINNYKSNLDKLNDIYNCENAKLENAIINKKEMEHLMELKKHSQILLNYYYEYYHFVFTTERNKSRTQLCDEIENIKNNLIYNLQEKETELKLIKHEITKYMDLRIQIDNKSNELEIYRQYSKLTDYDGLPYELLKIYLPIIETKINQILHQMVSFSIDIQFFSDDDKKQLKSNISSIIVNICHEDSKPYNAEGASGFEKFIIGLAIRITLCHFSHSVKPNFIIIDEGWNCMDSENLQNLEPIMNYIRTQFDHVIIISHVAEMKEQADYMINIERIKGLSKCNFA
jgi:DNA repair exonuclease SbcCD ATPase subunit